MSIRYRIYSNDGVGGPVDYSTPIATTAALSYTTSALAPSGIYLFAVHAFDTVSGIEEANTQACVRVALDPAGNAIAPQPNAPLALVARLTANAGCQVNWAYQPAGQAAPPISFQVYLTPGTTPNLSTPVASVAYVAGILAYSCQLGGLANGMVYTVAVVAQAATGAAASTPVSATILGDTTPPEDVDSLIALAVP